MPAVTASLGRDALRALFARAGVAILVANDQGVYVDVNEAATRLLGVERDDLIGRSLSDFIDPKRAKDVKNQWQEFLRIGSQSGTFELRKLNGDTCRVRFVATANFFPGLHSSFLIAADPE